MVAKGKVNASKVQVNDRIIVKWFYTGEGREYIHESATKTGEGVHVARVLAKTFRAARGPYEARGKYVIETTSGTFEAATIETMWLAPEDTAGIKRAHVEALAEDRERELAAHEALAAELAEDRERELVAHEALAIEAELAEADHAEALVIEAEREIEARADEARWSLGSIDDMHGLALTLNSQAGKVDNMNNDTSTEAPKLENATGSTVVRVLEKVWARIREDHVDLPEVVIITGSGLLGGSKWGHFRADGWKVREEGSALRKHELFLAGEALAKGATQVLQTMLHEGAHTLAKVRGLQDTSRQGRWHNAKFKDLAAEMGLEHKSASADSSHGFSFVTLTEATKARHADLLAELDAEIKLTCHLPLWLGGDEDDKGGEKITGKPPTKTEGGSTSNNVKTTCLCEEPNIIRMSRKVLDKKIVRCDDCDGRFMER